MTRGDYLNPDSMRLQCSQAISRMEEDNQALKAVGESICEFAADPEIESRAFYALKQQLKDYQTVAEAMILANTFAIRDFRLLSACVGDEVLDGEIIFSQMENALRLKESYLIKEAVYRGKMMTAQEPALYFYYCRMAGGYGCLAESSQRLYDRWRERTERFDEVSEGTRYLFQDSGHIGPLIQKGLSELPKTFRGGAYVYDKDSVWQKQLKNECLRLSMCFGDKGGDQNGPYALWQRGIESDREYIRELVHGYKEYADYSDDEIEKLLIKLGDEGCGYVAFANIIADEYRGKEEEFRAVFGFPLFLENANGYEYIDYNRLTIDLYCASDNRDANGVYDYGEDRSAISGAGTSPDSRICRFERYMADCGVDVSIRNVECNAQNVYEKCREETDKGNRLIIRTCPVRLADEMGEPAYMDGSHAMTVTGLTDDGRIEVSSWGEKYYITPEDPDYVSPEKNRAREAYIKLQSVSFKKE